MLQQEFDNKSSEVDLKKFSLKGAPFLDTLVKIRNVTKYFLAINSEVYK